MDHKLGYLRLLKHHGQHKDIGNTKCQACKDKQTFSLTLRYGKSRILNLFNKATVHELDNAVTYILKLASFIAAGVRLANAIQTPLVLMKTNYKQVLIFPKSLFRPSHHA